jgi:xylulokinase
VHYLIGIDLGTSSLKTLIIDEDGNVQAVSTQDYQFSSPYSGYAEQDPKVWWDACCKTIREAIAKSSIKEDKIAGVSFSGQMHGVVLLDEKLEVIRPSILHCDARSSKQVQYIKKTLGEDSVKELVMNPIYSGFLLPSLLWVRENEPENYKRVCHVLLPKDYIKFKLSGVISSDYSDASATLAFDIKNVRWSKEILDIFSIPIDIFPTCFNTDEAIGTVCENASKQTGLSTKTIVVAGGGDQVMQGIGNGITYLGGSSVNIGSSGQVSFQSDVPILNPKLSTNTFCGYKKGRWITMGAIMNAGLSLKWCNQLLGQKDYIKINNAVSKVLPGSNGVIFLPYLNGERTPHLNPDISGEFVGININTGPAELTRSVMEGVAFALMQCIELCGELGLKAKDYIVASGGASRSATWLQIQADIYNIPIRVMETEEQASLGAAIVAGVGVGIFRDIEDGCRRTVRYKNIEFIPDTSRHQIYMEYYQLFKEIYIASEVALNKVTLLGRKIEKSKYDTLL